LACIFNIDAHVNLAEMHFALKYLTRLYFCVSNAL
jgi:hypothetical protein